MFRFIVGLACALAFAAAVPPLAADPFETVFEEFDAAPMAPEEIRLLQTALASTGHYRGPLDGVWGAMSQRALEAYSWREFDDLPVNGYAALLVAEFLEEVARDGWDFMEFADTGQSMALPLLGLQTPALESSARDWRHPGYDLVVQTRRQDADGARRWHAARAAATTGARYELRDPDLMITGGVLADGRRFHTRSDRVGDGWSTLNLIGGDPAALAINLVAATIETGPPRPWILPANGWLDTLIVDTVSLLGEYVPEGDGGLPGDEAALATGTGFYLGAQLLVTARHVVAGCARVSLADGTDLDLLAIDPDLDVAALAAPAPARAWLRLSGSGAARLGQPVHALGFPYYSLTTTSLHLTSGNVSALAGMDDDRRFVSFTAPVQPGNSGGPLIDQQGGVAGVVVARISDSYILEATGAAPQNLNFALGAAELERFLDRNGLWAATDGMPAYDMALGAPADIERAVVPIVCH